MTDISSILFCDLGFMYKKYFICFIFVGIFRLIYNIAMLCLEFWTEKRASLGEDALPTLEVGDDNTMLLAVYDGLGGSGSMLYEVGESGNTFSGAYLASRCAKAVTEEFYKLWDKNSQTSFASVLEIALKYAFEAYRQELNAPPSRLKSKLIKTLPTTIAGILIEDNTHNIETTTFWAGDSRCYFLQLEGLQQITTDDLHGNPDALENLRLDATITNCVHAEGNFEIHSLFHIIDEPVVFLVATDGCFGYVETPMHFEYILLHTLMESHYDMEDWAEKLKEALLAITGDDMSLGLVAWGFENLEGIKSYFIPRLEVLKHEFIDVWEDIKTHTLPQEAIQQLWARYNKIA